MTTCGKVYTFTEEDFNKIASRVVASFSNKSFTKDDILKVFESVTSEKVSLHQFIEKYVKLFQGGDKLSNVYKNAVTYWSKLSTDGRKKFLHCDQKSQPSSNSLRKLCNLYSNAKSNDDVEDCKAFVLKGKKTSKYWMYIQYLDGGLELFSVSSNSFTKDKKMFNDCEQRDCFIIKQILLKKKKGWVAFEMH